MSTYAGEQPDGLVDEVRIGDEWVPLADLPNYARRLRRQIEAVSALTERAEAAPLGPMALPTEPFPTRVPGGVVYTRDLRAALNEESP